MTTPPCVVCGASVDDPEAVESCGADTSRDSDDPVARAVMTSMDNPEECYHRVGEGWNCNQSKGHKGPHGVVYVEGRPLTPAEALCVERITHALRLAWLDSNDAHGHALPPDLADHLAARLLSPESDR